MRLSNHQFNSVFRRIAGLLILSSIGSCNEKATVQSPKTASRPSLPESSFISRLTESDRRDRESSERNSIIERCNEIILSESFGGLKDEFQASAVMQASIIRDSLMKAEKPVFHCICARTGWTATGKAYLHAEVDNFGRDTGKIILIRKSGDKEVDSLVYDFRPTEKNYFNYCIQYVEGKFVEPGQLFGKTSGQGIGADVILVDSSSDSPIPSEFAPELILCCENMEGRRSNAVPVQRVDLATPHATQPTSP